MGDLVNSGSRYSDADRRAAAVSYAVHGNVARVSESLGIPATTIYGWRKSDWWDALSVEVRAEKQDEIVAGYTRIIDQALAETEDRLTHGDHVLHQGEIMRVPMKGRDTAVVAAIATDKTQLLLSRPTNISSKSDGMAALLAQFEQLARDSRSKVVSEQ